ncbi:MAG: hypothetical protein HYU75_11310 [Betaproteobacteria bacterium]|nr:hypothetical protein [Betaproteobacteria bacterium]
MPSLKPVLALLCTLGLANLAFAQQFAGQVVTMIVNYSAGGPTDVDARIVARHLPKHIQGVGSVVVRNVGGAGGNIGSLRVRYNDLKFIAGFQQASLLYIRRDTAPGVSKPADVAKARPFRAGALSPTNQATLRMRLALDLLGAKYEIIPGYKGLHDIEVAVRQGDIQVTHNSLSGWYTAVKPILVDTGIVIPLIQYDYRRPDGSLGRNPDAADVPAFLEVYKAIWGKDAMPSGEKWEALQLVNEIMDSMGRAVFMPPIAPAAAVEEMRAAMEKLSRDAEYIADYEKVVKFKPRFIVGAKGERIIAGLGSVKPSFVSFLRTYLGEKK